MEAYIILLGIVWGVIVIESNIKVTLLKVGNYNIPIVSIFLLIVFLGFYSFRDEIGYDYPMYVTIIYGGYANDIYASKGEILSALLLNIAGILDNHYIFFFLVALISLILIFYSIIKYTDFENKIGWGILTFMAIPVGFVYSLAIERQFMAISVLLFATRYLLKRSFIKYFMCVLIACLFHVTSVFNIILYIITSEKFKYKYFIFIFVIGGILTLGVKNIIISMFPFYEAYISSLNSFETGGKTQVVLYIIIAIWFLYVRTYLKNNSKYNVFLKSYICGMALTSFLLPFDANVAFRLGSLGLINLIFLMPYSFCIFSNNSKFIMKIFMIIICSIIYIYGLLVTTGTAYIPYKTFI